MNLECRYIWEKEIVPGDDHAMICLEVLGVHIDEDHLKDRTGEEGLLYNIHYQMNPEHVTKTGKSAYLLLFCRWTVFNSNNILCASWGVIL